MNMCRWCGSEDLYLQIYVPKNGKKNICSTCEQCNSFQLLPRSKENWLRAIKNEIKYSPEFKNRAYRPSRKQLKLVI